MNSHWSIRSFKSSHLFIEIVESKSLYWSEWFVVLIRSFSSINRLLLQSRFILKTYLKIVDSQIRLILNYFSYIFFYWFFLYIIFYSFFVVSSSSRHFLSWLNHQSKQLHKNLRTIRIISVWKNSSLSFVEIKSILNKSTYTFVRSFQHITSIKSEITTYTKQFFMTYSSWNKNTETCSHQQHEMSS